MKVKTLCLGILCFSLHLSTEGAISRPVLSPLERDKLRYQLQNLSNEMELLIKNEKSNKADVRRQEMDFSALKVYDRIPFTPDIKQLNEDLKKSANALHLKVLSVTLTHSSKPDNPPPHTVSASQPPFRFATDQLVEVIYFNATVSALSEEAVKTWIHSWPTEQMRLVEPDISENHHPLIVRVKQPAGPQAWTVKAHAFRFRTVQYPTILPRKAKTLLPRWAQKNLPTFATQEPLLWNLVTKIESLTPEAQPHYRERGQFYLNDARMNFFLSKLKNIDQTKI